VAIVDKKGRLFGLINLLDLIVILLVVGVAGLFTYRHFHKAGTAAVEGRDQTIEVEFRVPDVMVLDWSVMARLLGRVTDRCRRPGATRRPAAIPHREAARLRPRRDGLRRTGRKRDARP
jgi:hypothetical protein